MCTVCTHMFTVEATDQVVNYKCAFIYWKQFSKSLESRILNQEFMDSVYSWLFLSVYSENYAFPYDMWIRHNIIKIYNLIYDRKHDFTIVLILYDLIWLFLLLLLPQIHHPILSCNYSQLVEVFKGLFFQFNHFAFFLDLLLSLANEIHFHLMLFLTARTRIKVSNSSLLWLAADHMISMADHWHPPALPL